MASFVQPPLEMERSVHNTGSHRVPAVELQEDTELDTTHCELSGHSDVVASSEAYAQRSHT